YLWVILAITPYAVYGSDRRIYRRILGGDPQWDGWRLLSLDSYVHFGSALGRAVAPRAMVELLEVTIAGSRGLALFLDRMFPFKARGLITSEQAIRAARASKAWEDSAGLPLLT